MLNFFLRSLLLLGVGIGIICLHLANATLVYNTSYTATFSIDGGGSATGDFNTLFDGDLFNGKWITPSIVNTRINISFAYYTSVTEFYVRMGNNTVITVTSSTYLPDYGLGFQPFNLVIGDYESELKARKISYPDDFFARQINLVFKSNQSLVWRSIVMDGSHAPSHSPTLSPTRSPSGIPTSTPTRAPTAIPTPAPTSIPTSAPTGAPTFGIVSGRTPSELHGVEWQPFVQWSLNIYPLSERKNCQTNQTCTYYNFQPISEKNESETDAYCLTCILAWNEIDANLSIRGCELNFTQLDDHESLPTPFYFCDNGTYVLESTGRLADWQKTYLAIQIWEYDQDHQKFQLFAKEFQWNQTECTWKYSEKDIRPCDYLPLTGTNRYTARILFTMPKRKYDSRLEPLLIVWYDILGIPYGVRPPLIFSYQNMTFLPLTPGVSFSFADLLTTSEFRIPFYCMVSLLIMFILMSIAGVLKGRKGRAITKADYIIDTRNLRSIFQNLPETMVLEEKLLKSRSKFKFHKHGPYLCIVLLGRLAYMFVFTLTFFYVVFQSINQQHFQLLRQYNKFAHNRDNQLWNYSAEIETYYNNETDRMAEESEFRQAWCYEYWIVRVAAGYANKTATKFAYDSYQMQEPLRRFKGLNLTGADSMYPAGVTACETNPVKGARSLYYDEMCIYGAENSSVETCFEAEYYNRQSANFSDLQTALVETCLHTTDCVGWTWIDPVGSESGHFAVLSEFGDPQFTTNTSGICYLVARYDSNTFSMSSVNDLAGINAQLDQEYLEAYQTDVGNLYSTLQGLYASLKALNGYKDDTFNISVKVIPDPTATGVYTRVVQKKLTYSGSNGNLDVFMQMEIQIICPYCPQGNFSQPVLEKAFNYILNNTNFNLSDLGNHTGDYNFSKVVSVNTGLVKVPAIPNITLPLDINFPYVGLPLYWFLGFDTLLTIYRWYKTAGIMAGVIRGKDVPIELRHLMVRQKTALCCPNNEDIGDKVLSSVVYCTGYCSNVTYTCWKLFYWVWFLMQLLIVLFFLLLLYFLVDQIINLDFIEQLQIFQLLTSGLAAQRSVRNSVICTTALSYNNYTLGNMKVSRLQYAIEKNLQIVQWNKGELMRVNGFNSYFCSAWGQYLGTSRDVTQDGYPIKYNGSENMGTTALATLPNLFDNLVNSSWQPYTPTEAKAAIQAGQSKTVSIDIEFPELQITWTPHPNRSAYWHIDRVEFSWDFNKTNSQGYNSSYGAVLFTMYTKDNGSSTFEGQSTSTGRYAASDYAKVNDVHTVYFDDASNQTRWLRINFSSAEQWVDAFKLNSITVYGKVAKSYIACPFVKFSPVQFDASSPDYDTKYCPDVQPIFGIMYRHFVRSWLNEQLWDAHVPFIIAIRAICLSPFYILVIAVGGLICAYLVAFMIEWVLTSVDLMRENPYAPVPLVYSREEYDKTRHEPQAFADATIAHDYYRPDLKAMWNRVESIPGQMEQSNHLSTPTDEKKPETNVELQHPKQETNVVSAPAETYSVSPLAGKRLPPKPPQQPRISAEIDYPLDDMVETNQQTQEAGEYNFNYDDA